MGVWNNIQRWKQRCAMESSFNIVLLIVTAAIGADMWLLERVIYKAALDVIPRPILIAILFGLLYLILAIVVSVLSYVFRAFEVNLITWAKNDRSGVLKILIIGLAAVFILSALFQWIYGLNIIRRTQEPTSYIFLIDDSGSMTENDPNQQRYGAIPSVLKGMDDDFPFMVYSFSTDIQMLRKMEPISSSAPPLSGTAEGWTNIKGALERVLHDYEDGVWDGGAAPRVILLSDGSATDIGFLKPVSSLLRKFSRDNISISTVGLGDTNDSTMTKIASSTGGVYIHVEHAAELSEAMTDAAVRSSRRDLLSKRAGVKFNALYGILRVIFLTVLGSGIGILMSLAYGNQNSYALNNTVAVVTALLGALLMEIGTYFGAPQGILWLILWTLIAVTLGVYPNRKSTFFNDDDDDDDSNLFYIDQHDSYGAGGTLKSGSRNQSHGSGGFFST